ncbi:hypothetical protein NXS98_13650 [Fontisphaera persica]|uniref:hypothetical protein n=1 Tax=Fontisphaera persica TaxID=2974023 RepID=UPI0024C07102|nr:hypothetical protein [Fontisphaera persica]WCJ58754.1 hypothetical protein NXS98_13650 [Fontisphaera persica]
MTAGPHESWYRIHRLGVWFAGIYLMVAVLSSVACLMDRHEYSIPFFVLVYASFPVYLIGTEVLKPQTAFMQQLPHGELVCYAILVGLTTLLYYGIGQLLDFSLKSARRWLAGKDQGHE